ncbi:MAG: aminoglycoside nucleotidyltransferase [Actinobacteria bacterium]|nr:aminoglycoside nucleotidyltransferase [Actinomycetota bacterium]
MTEVMPTDVVSVLDLLEGRGASVWVDGGWGVDALLSKQTRPHSDLDIVIGEQDLSTVVEALEGTGFTRIPTKDDKDWNFVLGDSRGREVDIHVVVFDEEGDGIYGPAENGDMYPAESLSGEGEIEDRKVRCISAEWQARFHSGYEWDENDRRDMEALGRRFGIELPEDPQERLW